MAMVMGYCVTFYFVFDVISFFFFFFLFVLVSGFCAIIYGKWLVLFLTKLAVTRD